MLLIGWATVALLMLVLWEVQRRTGNAGIVDVGWAASIAGLAIFFAIAGDGHPQRRILVAAMTGTWGFRLAYYLARRVRREPEDGRYQFIREWAGARVQAFLFGFFQIQAIWAVLFAIPPLVVMVAADRPLGLFDLLGVVVFVAALIGEAIADRQLARFKARPDSRGKTCREGLWRYSRHPNYFFEWVHWFAYCVMAIGIGHIGWITLMGPALMLFFLLKVTGIPPTEQQALRSRGEDYRQYQQTTSPLIPWFPKETSS
jgi:steroid 5-alpha reductase family enzyme